MVLWMLLLFRHQLEKHLIANIAPIVMVLPTFSVSTLRQRTRPSFTIDIVLRFLGGHARCD